jgi:hypothetical protein
MDKSSLPVSQEKINQWKNQHNGRVFQVSVTDDDDAEYHAFFKEPDMKTMSAVAHESKTDEVKASELLFNACKLHVDDAIEQITTLKLSVMRDLGNVVSLKKTTFQKL